MPYGQGQIDIFSTIMENLDFGLCHGQNFEILDMVKNSLTMTVTPRRRPNGQKIVVAPPQTNLSTQHFPL